MSLLCSGGIAPGPRVRMQQAGVCRSCWGENHHSRTFGGFTENELETLFSPQRQIWSDPSTSVTETRLLKYSNKHVSLTEMVEKYKK